ncbi:hypothetical protein SEA_KARDASHIAN_74 [Streptomyces phage Kardashian]|nr:hypothetical protein SEA_KARDASHIAN_74 [Streptomyces phage Kardashian]
MIVDTVLDHRMHPVLVREPVDLRRILRKPYPETWLKVLIGETQKIVTIPEYLYRETLEMTVRELRELTDRKDLAMYKRDPKRWEDQLERTAIKLIKRIQEDA